MTPSLPLPTDNVYKFVCLFGLTLVVVGVFSFLSSYYPSLERAVRYSEAVISLEAKPARTKAEEDLLAMNKRLIEMGTRAEFWAQNEGKEITSEEWLAYVASDPEFRLSPENGRHFALWSGCSKYEEPWLDWFQGNVKSKWPDTALYRKMLRIAVALQAQIQDDDGNVYRTENDWEFDPNSTSAPSTKSSASWFKRLFRR